MLASQLMDGHVGKISGPAFALIRCRELSSKVVALQVYQDMLKYSIGRRLHLAYEIPSIDSDRALPLAPNGAVRPLSRSTATRSWQVIFETQTSCY